MGEFKMKKELTIFGGNKNIVNNIVRRWFPFAPIKKFNDKEIKQKKQSNQKIVP